MNLSASQADGSSRLSADQLKFYDRNGYIIVKNCISQHDIDRFVARMKEICENRADFPLITVMRDVALAKTAPKADMSSVTKIQDWQDDEVLFDYCKNERIVSIVKQLIGHAHSNLVSMVTMAFNKPPDPGSLTSRHPLHQDLLYFPFRPADGICCSWTALVPVNRQNGCLVVLPGSHKGDLKKHDYPKWEGGVNFAYYGIQDFDATAPRTYVEMDAGDTVFFHPLLIHGSGANRSDGFRRAISCHYANDDICHYHHDDNTNNEETMNKLKTLIGVKFTQLGLDSLSDEDRLTFMWKLRARPINGTKSNL